MRTLRIQPLRALREEMKAVARGERSAPRGAGGTSYDSVEALVRLLTPENRRMLAAIRDRRPASVAELAAITGRAAPNVTRTLAKLEGAGLIRLTVSGRRKAPALAVRKLVVTIDPCAESDTVAVG